MAEKTTGASVAPAAVAAPAVETTPALETDDLVLEAESNALGNIDATNASKKYSVAFVASLVESAKTSEGKTFFSIRAQRFIVDKVARRDFPWISDGVATTSNRITKGWQCVLQLISNNPVGRMLIAKTKGHPQGWEGAEELVVFMLMNMKVTGEVVILPAGTPMFDGSLTMTETANFNITSATLNIGAQENAFLMSLLKDLKKVEMPMDEPLVLE